MHHQGIWTLNEAAQHHIHSQELAQALTSVLSAEQPVFDLGCGLGFYADYLTSVGYQVAAYEGTEDIEAVSIHKPIYQLDLSVPVLSWEPKGQVMCLEVGEHIPAKYEDIVIDNLCTIAQDLIILSWAVPGQGGVGHVNEKPNYYIIRQFEKRGWRYDGFTSRTLRGQAGNCWWFKNTILCFRRP